MKSLASSTDRQQKPAHHSTGLARNLAAAEILSAFSTSTKLSNTAVSRATASKRKSSATDCVRVRLDKCWRFDIADLDAWIESHKEQIAQETAA